MESYEPEVTTWSLMCGFYVDTTWTNTTRISESQRGGEESGGGLSYRRCGVAAHKGRQMPDFLSCTANTYASSSFVPVGKD
jgi:hypothetical protein